MHTGERSPFFSFATKFTDQLEERELFGRKRIQPVGVGVTYCPGAGYDMAVCSFFILAVVEADDGRLIFRPRGLGEKCWMTSRRRGLR